MHGVTRFGIIIAMALGSAGLISCSALREGSITRDVPPAITVDYSGHNSITSEPAVEYAAPTDDYDAVDAIAPSSSASYDAGYDAGYGAGYDGGPKPVDDDATAYVEETVVVVVEAASAGSSASVSVWLASPNTDSIEPANRPSSSGSIAEESP